MSQRLLALLFAFIQTAPCIVSAAENGEKAPDCALTTFGDAQHITLQQYKGKVLYVDFWASWCTPCAKSFPFLNDLHRDFKESGLQIIGVNLDEEADDAKTFLAQYPAYFNVATDTGEACAKAFDVKAMPSSYLIDRKGIIRYVHRGFRADESKELRTLVEELIKETP